MNTDTGVGPMASSLPPPVHWPGDLGQAAGHHEPHSHHLQNGVRNPGAQQKGIASHKCSDMLVVKGLSLHFRGE